METLATSWSASDAGVLVDRLGELVGYETPPGSVSHLTACADLLAAWGTRILGREPRYIFTDGLPHLLWAAPDQRVLFLGHFDTVWSAGTLAEWPFEVTGTIATGPGVCDMKSGIVQAFAALSAMPDTSHVGVLLTCDEESGSTLSRPLIEAEARRSGAVLVGEASSPNGALKIARKGGSAYRLTARGRAAHAGVEPHRGINATVEIAHQALMVGAFADAEAQTSVTPTTLVAGTTSNTVPESATLSIDVRAWSGGELERVDRLIRALPTHVEGSRLELDGGISRYPLTTDMAQPLFEIALKAAADLGITLPEGAHAPGASDANFTAAAGALTLDGLGGVGGGAHARSEFVDVARMPERAALLARLMERIVTR